MPKKKDYISQTELAEYREANCPLGCPILGLLSFITVVDHDHKTGRIRGVVSNEGNALLGKIENFYRSRCARTELDLPRVLRNIAIYLEEEQGPMHPVGTRQVTKRFGRMKKSEQEKLLRTVSPEVLAECKNSADRTKLYRRMIVK